MITLETAIAKIKQLPTEDQKEIIRFVEFLEFKSGKAITDQEEVEITEPKSISFAEAVKDLIGYLDGLPPDLSTNKTYMESFGK